MTYEEFLKSKSESVPPSGFDIDVNTINKKAFPFQVDLIKWACKKGKCALLTGCGTGKSLMSLEWARAVHNYTGRNILIFAPLAVVNQTIKEAAKFDIGEVTKCRSMDDVKHGINITNYEMMEHFTLSAFGGVVLDESSILKGFNSKTTGYMIQELQSVPYRLLCTATIAPNDYTEIGTSCEALGIMSRTEMLATYFVHDGGKTSDWRLKKSGRDKFWEWLATWAVYFDNPSELGYDVAGYDLPKLNMQNIITKSEPGEYEFFAKVAETLEERREARKESMVDRTDIAAKLANESDEQWLMWVDYNDESDMLTKKTDNCVEIRGSDTPEHKADSALKFSNGEIHALVSKSSIFGFGCNFQSCHNMIFCGLSDSYERFYQAIRRCWRFGQENQVNVYIILSEKELSVLENIKKKQAQMDEMQKQMTALMRDVTMSEIQHTTRITETYFPEEEMEVPSWI